jgi:hypothetical protein
MSEGKVTTKSSLTFLYPVSLHLLHPKYIAVMLLRITRKFQEKKNGYNEKNAVGFFQSGFRIVANSGWAIFERRTGQRPANSNK